MTAQFPALHAVTTDAIVQLADFETRAAAIAHAPGVALHVRARELPGRILTELVDRVKRATRSAGASVFVNDRADVALLTGSAGVHLPSDGLPIAAVREMVGPNAWIGRSTHRPDEARRAMDEGADYVFLGPIWETGSHQERPPLGPAAIQAAHPARVVAIGGVTPGRIGPCRDAGAVGVAAISALWAADRPGTVAAEMLLLLEA